MIFSSDADDIRKDATRSMLLKNQINRKSASVFRD